MMIARFVCWLWNNTTLFFSLVSHAYTVFDIKTPFAPYHRVMYLYFLDANFVILNLAVHTVRAR